MLQRSRKLVGRPNVQEIVCGALGGNDTCSRSISERLGPCCDIRMVAFGVDIELLAEVGIQRCEAMLAATIRQCRAPVEAGLTS